MLSSAFRAVMSAIYQAPSWVSSRSQASLSTKMWVESMKVRGRGTGAQAPMLSLCQVEDLRANKNYFRTATAQNPYFYKGNKTFPCLFEDEH